MTTSREADRSSASGTVGDLETVAKTATSRSPKAKKAVATPDAGQLRNAATRARKAGIPQLAEKYDKIAADTARHDALALERGAEDAAER